jgi:cell division protein FtsB
MTRDYSGLLIDISKLTTDVRDTLTALTARNDELERKNKKLKTEIEGLNEECRLRRAEVVMLRHKLDDAMEGRKR